MEQTPLEITCHELDAFIDSKSARLIDCREVDEFAICKLPDSENRPLSRWGGEWKNWFTDKDQETVIICHHGMRSLRGVMFLREHGFERTTSLQGGIDQWSVEIDPSVPRY